MLRREEFEGGAVQFRAAEIKEMSVENREMFVRAVPYNVTQDIGSDILETFEEGTFARAVKAPQRVSAWWEHGGPMIGRGIQVIDQSDGVWIRAKIGRTNAANDVISLFEDKLIKDVSIEFRPIPEAMSILQDGKKLSVRHRRAHLLGFAVVSNGAYGDGAYIASVRDEQLEREREAARLWLQAVRQRGRV